MIAAVTHSRLKWKKPTRSWISAPRGGTARMPRKSVSSTSSRLTPSMRQVEAGAPAAESTAGRIPPATARCAPACRAATQQRQRQADRRAPAARSSGRPRALRPTPAHARTPADERDQDAPGQDHSEHHYQDHDDRAEGDPHRVPAQHAGLRPAQRAVEAHVQPRATPVKTESMKSLRLNSAARTNGRTNSRSYSQSNPQPANQNRCSAPPTRDAVQPRRPAGLREDEQISQAQRPAARAGPRASWSAASVRSGVAARRRRAAAGGKRSEGTPRRAARRPGVRQLHEAADDRKRRQDDQRNAHAPAGLHRGPARASARRRPGRPCGRCRATSAARRPSPRPRATGRRSRDAQAAERIMSLL